MSFSKLGSTALPPQSLGHATYLLPDVSETRHNRIPREHYTFHNQLVLCSLAIPQSDLVTFKDDLSGSKSNAWPSLKGTELRPFFLGNLQELPKNDMPKMKHLLSARKDRPLGPTHTFSGDPVVEVRSGIWTPPGSNAW